MHSLTQNYHQTKKTIDYHETKLLGTLTFEKHWEKSKTEVVDLHWTKNGQNVPSCSRVLTVILGVKNYFEPKYQFET